MIKPEYSLYVMYRTRGGLMVTAIDSWSNGPTETTLLFSGKPLYYHSASLHPGVEMGTG